MSAWLGVLLAATNAVPLWITFDIANPGVVGGHRILHLEDVIGPGQRADIPRLPSASAVLMFAVRADDCDRDGLCGRVARWSEAARAAQGLVVAVVLTERDRADAVRATMARLRLPIALAVDAHGVVRSLAGLDVPGTFVVIDGQGRSRRWTPPAGRATVTPGTLDEIRGAFLDAAQPPGG